MTAQKYGSMHGELEMSIVLLTSDWERVGDAYMHAMSADCIASTNTASFNEDYDGIINVSALMLGCFYCIR